MPTVLLASQGANSTTPVASYLPARMEAGFLGSPQPQEAKKVVIRGNMGGSIVLPSQRPSALPHRVNSGSVVITSSVGNRHNQGNRITLPSGGSVVLQSTPAGMGVRRSFSPLRRNTTSMGPCKGMTMAPSFQPRPSQSLGDRGPMPSIATANGLSGSPLPVFRPSPDSPVVADDDEDNEDNEDNHNSNTTNNYNKSTIDETIQMDEAMIEEMFQVSTAAFCAAAKRSETEAAIAVAPTVMEEPDEVMALPTTFEPAVQSAPWSLPPLPMQEPSQSLSYQPEQRARPSPLLDLSSNSLPPPPPSAPPPCLTAVIMMAPQLGQSLAGDNLDRTTESASEVRFDGLAPPPRRSLRLPECAPKLDLPVPSTPDLRQTTMLSELDETMNVIPTSRPPSGPLNGPEFDQTLDDGTLAKILDENLEENLDDKPAESTEHRLDKTIDFFFPGAEPHFDQEAFIINNNNGTVPTPPRASTPPSPAYWDPMDPMMNKVGDWQDKFMSAWMGDLAMPGFDDDDEE
mmetsp:Transcript_65727/g.137407  ORF Transcript_65727/g.137407 Transcript_65727/m.137407 type:complete len:515 (+) Transcript_65727:247-1791(+)